MVREEELKAVGDELLKIPSSSVNKLLECLKKLDDLLSIMSQNEKTGALLPAMTALISGNLFKHSDEEVKILVTSCITQITRITAPDPPFDDDNMKNIFQLIVEAFEKLSDDTDLCYNKAVSILDNVSIVRSSVVMLDLECNNLIIQMFQHFLRIIRLNHSDEIFRNVKNIMTTVLEESEDVSSDLLGLLLDSLVKDNQAVSPESWALAEQVFAECSDKLKPYIQQAVQSRGRNIDDYSEIVASMCHGGAGTIQHESSNAYRMELVPDGLKPDKTCMEDATQVMHETESNVKNASCSAMNAETVKKGPKRQRQQLSDLSKDSKSNVKPSSESIKESKSETLLHTLPKKRGRKPNSLKNPDEGYKYLTSKESKSARSTESRKALDMVPPENLERKCVLALPKTIKNDDASLPAVEGSSLSQRHPKRGRPKKRSVDGRDATSKEDLSNSLPENTPLELPGVRTGRDSEVIKDVDVEPQPQPSTRKTTVDGMKSRTFSEDEEEPKSAVNIQAENIEEDRALVLTNVKKRRKHGATLNTDLNESSFSKELITESATKSSKRLVQIPQARPRRKCAVAWDEDPLVGMRIKVWWPMDKKFYVGIVDSFDRQKKKHKILYEDGDMELLNLEKECWNLIDDDALPDTVREQGIDVEKPEVASNMKGKSKSEPAKGRKARSSLRRSDDGKDSAGKSKSAKGANVNHEKRSKVSASSPEVKNSGDNSAPKEPVMADESADAPSRTRTRTRTRSRTNRGTPKP